MNNAVRTAFRHPQLRLLRKVIRPFLGRAVGSEQWLRIVMDRETEKLINSLNPSSLNVLEISGTRWDQPNLFRKYKSVTYPDFDICERCLDETYDLIIAEQVFEHLLWPYRAGRNVFAMLRPGGHFLITTPFLIRIHKSPADCTRWTETGMKHFLAECGFALDEIQVSSWGNRACVKANFGPWQIYQSWRHSLRNESDFPVVVWAMARKSVTC